MRPLLIDHKEPLWYLRWQLRKGYVLMWLWNCVRAKQLRRIRKKELIAYEEYGEIYEDHQLWNEAARESDEWVANQANFERTLAALQYLRAYIEGRRKKRRIFKGLWR